MPAVSCTSIQDQLELRPCLTNPGRWVGTRWVRYLFGKWYLEGQIHIQVASTISTRSRVRCSSRKRIGQRSPLPLYPSVVCNIPFQRQIAVQKSFQAHRRGIKISRLIASRNYMVVFSRNPSQAHAMHPKHFTSRKHSESIEHSSVFPFKHFLEIIKQLSFGWRSFLHRGMERSRILMKPFPEGHFIIVSRMRYIYHR